MLVSPVCGVAAHVASASRLRNRATKRGSCVKTMASASEPAPLVATSWRTSALAARHKALGSALEDWNGMGTGAYAGARQWGTRSGALCSAGRAPDACAPAAWVYTDDPTIEKAHVAIRTKCGLMVRPRQSR